MTPRQIILSHITAEKALPRGTLIWLFYENADDLISLNEVGDNLERWHQRVWSPEEIQVILDMPDDDSEVWLFSPTKLFSPRVKTPVLTARDRAVARYGVSRVMTAEKVVFLYSGYLLHLYRQAYGFTGPAPEVRVNWSAKHSWGGRSSITISPSSIYPDSDTPRYRYHEYAHIEQRKDIGAFYSINQLDHIKGVVAHELAHFCQRHTGKDNFKFGFPVLPEKDFRTAHGDGWQFLYAFFRTELNKRIQR